MHRNHLAEGAAGEACAGHIDEIEPAGLWLELRLPSHPADDLLRIGQESKHRGAGGRDMRLAADDESVLHRVSSHGWSRCPSLRLKIDRRGRLRHDGSRKAKPIFACIAAFLTQA